MIETANLRKVYKKRHVVNDVSIRVDRGEVVGLLGPNGAGKTTTFYMVVGLVRPNSGDIKLDGKSISRLPMHQRARRGVGYLPQEASVFRKLTVEENILAVWQLRGVSRKDQARRLEEILDEFRISHIRHNKGFQLSGGERRRVEIARAVATNPSFLLLDEPFAGIDPIAVGGIKDMISYLRTRNIGVLITDHNVRETLAITDRAYILSEGRVVEAGDTETIANSEIARKYYLGDDFVLDLPTHRRAPTTMASMEPAPEPAPTPTETPAPEPPPEASPPAE
jgi:lipopolysaccharide export system ATP-binding protein